MIIKAKRIHPDAKLPAKAFPSDAGFDLFLPVSGAVPAGQWAWFPLGIAMEIAEGYYGQVQGRSGLAMDGIAAFPGVVDSSYRGEVRVVLFNHGSNIRFFNPGDKVAQLLILPVPQFSLELADELSPSDRGASGFGSSGR